MPSAMETSKSSSPPPVPAASAPPVPVPPTTLPPGSTFDILPSVLSALQILLQSPSLTVTNTNSSSSISADHNSNVFSLSPSNKTTGDPITSNTTTATKDLPALMVSVKQRIAAARATVAALPDVDRTVEEQEEEIREVQTRIERLAEAWEGFVEKNKEKLTEFEGRSEDDEEMGGVEEN